MHRWQHNGVSHRPFSNNTVHKIRIHRNVLKNDMNDQIPNHVQADKNTDDCQMKGTESLGPDSK